MRPSAQALAALRRAEPYEAAAATLLAESGCRVRRYRTRNTGVAYTSADDWGIEVPRPRGPVSFGVFAHEVAHHVLRHGRGQARWRKELEAWLWALDQFDRFGLAGVDRARADAASALRHAVRKAVRRSSPATARVILDTMPAWTWELYSDPRDAITDEARAALVLRAAGH